MGQEKLGIGAGLRAFVGGVGFIVRTPAVWPYAMAPMVSATVLFGALGALGVWAALGAGAAAIEAMVGTDGGALAEAGVWILRVVFSALAILVAALLALSLAQPLSGWAIDRIVRAQERELGAAPWPESQALASMLRSLRVTLVGLLLSLPALAALTLVELLFPPAAAVATPLKVLVAAIVASYDFLDYPLGQRGFGVRDRLAWMMRHKGAVVGFGLAAGATLLVPCVGLLVLPMGAAGAARLAVEAERAGARGAGSP